MWFWAATPIKSGTRSYGIVAVKGCTICVEHLTDGQMVSKFCMYKCMVSKQGSFPNKYIYTYTVYTLEVTGSTGPTQRGLNFRTSRSPSTRAPRAPWAPRTPRDGLDWLHRPWAPQARAPPHAPHTAAFHPILTPPHNPRATGHIISPASSPHHTRTSTV